MAHKLLKLLNDGFRGEVNRLEEGTPANVCEFLMRHMNQFNVGGMCDSLIEWLLFCNERWRMDVGNGS